LREHLRGTGLPLRTGPFVLRLHSDIPALAEGIALLYDEHPVADDAKFVDFSVRVERASGLRRWWRPQAQFRCDGFNPFKPLPVNQALPLLEWGMNWSIAQHAHWYLIFHAAAVERGGRVAILPGKSGSGKSTLCAALVHRGWRLLTDEMTLLSLDDGTIAPLARPVSLKNESIEVIRRFANPVFSPSILDTAKGTLALMKPPSESIARAAERALPAWVVFPTFSRHETEAIRHVAKTETFIDLANNSFNYYTHGRRGFDLLAGLIDRSSCYALTFRNLDTAIAVFDDLAEDRQIVA
jgi:HprK-related kinase A